jgi:hypothetical protein
MHLTDGCLFLNCSVERIKGVEGWEGGELQREDKRGGGGVGWGEGERCVMNYNGPLEDRNRCVMIHNAPVHVPHLHPFYSPPQTPHPLIINHL